MESKVCLYLNIKEYSGNPKTEESQFISLFHLFEINCRNLKPEMSEQFLQDRLVLHLMRESDPEVTVCHHGPPDGDVSIAITYREARLASKRLDPMFPLVFLDNF